MLGCHARVVHTTVGAAKVGLATTQVAAGATLAVGKTAVNVGKVTTQAAAGATMKVGKTAAKTTVGVGKMAVNGTVGVAQATAAGATAVGGTFARGTSMRKLQLDGSGDGAAVKIFVQDDGDGDGNLDFEDFLPWYIEAVDAAKAVAESFQSLLVGRRTIEQFDQTPVSDDILERAVQCAIAATNRSMSEPWRFIRVG